MMSTSKTRDLLSGALLTLAALHLGACIEAAPFAGADAAEDDGVIDASADASSDDSGASDSSTDEGSGPGTEVQPDGDGSDGTQGDTGEVDGTEGDTGGPCDEVDCECSGDAPCGDGLTCHNGVCCMPLCSETVVCGSDGCGGDCGACENGASCTEAQSCAIGCAPGENVCGLGEDKDLVYLCNDEGTGYDPSVDATDCTGLGKGCFDGKCIECAPNCDSEDCSDDGENDGCGGLCPETCEDGQLCGEDGACASAGCAAGEVFCHENQPYLCEDGTLDGALAAGAVVDCDGAPCLVQNFGDSEAVDLLDDLDLYCACSEPQHCITEGYLHYCNMATGQAALLQCGVGEVCDDASNACVVEEESGGDECCAEHFGQCGFIEACGGICSCQDPEVYPDGYSCSNQGTCTASCSSEEHGYSQCVDDWAFKLCTPNGWTLSACPDDQTCENDDTAPAAKCVDDNPQESDDEFALSMNASNDGGVGSLGSQFGKVSDHEDFSFASPGGDTPFSLSLWIWGGDLGSGDVQPLIRKGGAPPVTAGISGGEAEWILYAHNKRFVWTVYNSAGVAWSKLSLPVTAEINGNWAHLVLTYAGNNKNSPDPHQHTKFYVNGVNQTDTTGSGQASSSAAGTSFAGTVNGGASLQIGFVPVPQTAWFQGGIDDLAILRTYIQPNNLPAMTAGQTQCGSDLTETALGDHLVAFWRFEDTSENMGWSDSLVNDHTITLQAEPILWDSPCSSP